MFSVSVANLMTVWRGVKLPSDLVYADGGTLREIKKKLGSFSVIVGHIGMYYTFKESLLLQLYKIITNKHIREIQHG